MKIVKEIKIDFFHFYFLNTDFSFTICNINIKLEGYIQNIPPEGSVSQNFELGSCFICMSLKDITKNIS